MNAKIQYYKIKKKNGWIYMDEYLIMKIYGYSNIGVKLTWINNWSLEGNY